MKRYLSPLMFMLVLSACNDETSKEVATDQTTGAPAAAAAPALPAVPPAGKTIQRLRLKPNGFKGNLSYKEENGKETPIYRYFYLENDTTIDLPAYEGTYALDNGAYIDGSAFGIIKGTDGSISLQAPEGVGTFSMVTDPATNKLIPQIALNPSVVKIKTNKLKLAYRVSAFQSVKGNSTTDGAQFNYFSNDTTVTLIKGLKYHIDNGCSIGCCVSSAFYFLVDKNGIVRSENPGAATIKNNNIIAFNVTKVSVDPYLITGKKDIPVRFSNGNKGFHIIKEKETLVVFNYLATSCTYTEETTDKDFIFKPIN